MRGLEIMNRAFALLAVIAIASAAQPAGAQPLRQRLEDTRTLAARKQWSEAEAEARETVRRFPESRDAQLTLAQVVLWRGRYTEARTLFARLVARNAEDIEARLGAAQAAYWSGDYREALREFRAILRRRPDHPDARRAVGEILSAARPGYSAGAGGISDDQPYRSMFGGVTAYAFSDPLTKWQLGAGTTRLRTDRLSADVREITASGETVLPRAAIHVQGALRWMRFPDERSELLPLVSIGRRFGRSRAAVAWQRRELLRARTALHSHPFADVLSIRWSHDHPGAPQFSAGAERLRYFDGNHGTSADAYGLFPVGRIALGASAAWRDTREPRFRPDTGEYDPYWTPHDLREARLIAAASARRGNVTLDLHLDGGVARDRVLYLFAESPSFQRTFHPWRASLAVTAPLSPRGTLSLSAERSSTVFYTANEIRASLAGRF
ncbi:MAG TPA: tetratricopeptide repeat protein [Thermoanaerobaculia bacterium]|nr:tetratricopeptide repeat protein [Thermoanaerobaculia bacterium]